MQKNKTDFPTLLLQAFNQDEYNFYYSHFSKTQKNKYTAYFLNFQRYRKNKKAKPISNLKSPSEYLEMQYDNGMSFDEISAKLGISHFCARENFAKGMKKIRELIETNEKYKNLKDFLI